MGSSARPKLMLPKRNRSNSRIRPTINRQTNHHRLTTRSKPFVRSLKTSTPLELRKAACRFTRQSMWKLRSVPMTSFALDFGITTRPTAVGARVIPRFRLCRTMRKVDRVRNEATVRFGNFTSTLTVADMGWGHRQPKDEFKNGYLGEFEIKEVDEKNRRLKVELSQVPAVQGAMMTLNAKNGEIVTMVGGYDFYTNKFNNAIQAYRQTGSCFKPFIYTAAVEWGMTPDTVVSGAPISIGDWQPHNYDGSSSCGDMPMKTALAKSMNIPAVHLLQTVGIQTGAQMVRRFGIKVPMSPYLPSALGATEVPLDQMVSAYSAFPNKGIRVEPHMIRKVL